MEALVRQLEGLARQQPVVMVFEDVHWIDPTSRELLDLIVEHVRSLPVLLIVTFRPEFQPPWTGQPQVTMLALNRLDRGDRISLVAQIAGDKALPDDVISQIADRTDGVPLFVEELTKGVLESGLLREEADRYVLDGALPPFAIPTSLHDSLMARLDRLGVSAASGADRRRDRTRVFLRAAACRVPPSGGRAASLPRSARRLRAGFPAWQAARRGLCLQARTGAGCGAWQPAAWPRQQLHAQIAEALETHSPEMMDSQPELFAQHYAEAGLVEKSVAYWGKAGRRSAARSAMAEASAQLQMGLNQLALLPDNPERQRRNSSFTVPWVRFCIPSRAMRRRKLAMPMPARESCGSSWVPPQNSLGCPLGSPVDHVFRGELDLAQRLDEDLLRLSRQRNDAAGLVLGTYSSGRNLMFAGRFVSSRSHLEDALALYDRNSHGSLVDQVGIHPQVVAQAYLGTVLVLSRLSRPGVGSEQRGYR